MLRRLLPVVLAAAAGPTTACDGDGNEPAVDSTSSPIVVCGTPPCLLDLDTAVSTTTTQRQHAPAVAAMPDGLTLVVFRDDQDGGDSIRGRFIAEDGTPLGVGDFVINTMHDTVIRRPDVAVAVDGTFLVAWEGDFEYDFGIRARRLRLDAAGTGPSFVDAVDFPIPADTRTPQAQVAIAAAPDNTFVVVWRDGLHDPSFAGVRLRRVPTIGPSVGPDIQVNTTKTGVQNEPDIAISADGSYVVVFTDASAAGTEMRTNIRVRAFSANDVALGPDALYLDTYGYQREPAIAVADDNGWYMFVYTSSGTPTGPAELRVGWISHAGVAMGGSVVESTGWGAQGAIGYDAAANMFLIAWTDGSGAAPDTSPSAVRVRQFRLDDPMTLGPDQVLATTMLGSQQEPAVAQRGERRLYFAWDSPDAAGVGVRGRMYQLQFDCPTPITDFFADPNAVRPPGFVPNGARSPAECAFPSLTKAISAANDAAWIHGSARAIASSDSTPVSTTRFTKEAFPLRVDPGVTLTTTDAADGGTFDPARYEIVVNRARLGVTSVRLLGASTRQGVGGAMRGLTLRESTCEAGCPLPPVAIQVDGFGVESDGSAPTPRLDRVRVLGGPTWATGILVRGNGLIEDVEVAGFASATAERVGLHVDDDAGNSVHDRVTLAGITASGNNVGLLITGGRVRGDASVLSSVASAGGPGNGIVVRDYEVVDGVTTTTPIDLAGALGSSANANHGIVVDLKSPASVVALDASTVSGNGGVGIQVLGAPRADVPLDGISGLTEYGFTLSGSEIAGNGGAGIVIGDLAQATAITARIGGLGGAQAPNSVYANGGPGLAVSQAASAACPDAATACTAVTIAGNTIVDNAGPGVRLGTAVLMPASADLGLGFAGNAIGHNAMAGPGCESAQDQPQILVVGPVAMAPGACDEPAIDTAAECSDQGAATTSTNGLVNHCAWTGTDCVVAWDLRGDLTGACELGYANTIFAYNTTDTGSLASVGLRAIDGAVVNADNNVWRSDTVTDNVSQDPGSAVQASSLCGTTSDCAP